MARAAAASPSGARYLPFSKAFRAARPAISGHARLLARPAYQKLLAAEPFLRRLIPILIIIFLSIVGLARFVELYQVKLDREREARDMITMIASVLASTLDKPEIVETTLLPRHTLLNTLADSLPPSATGDGRRIFVTDPDGIVVATAPRSVDDEGKPLTVTLGEAQPLTTFGARAGVLEIALADETLAFATVHHLRGNLGAVAVIEPTSFVYDDWRADISLNVTIFIGTSAILLVILYGYFAQSSRANEADRIYSETQARFETALTRGRSGLWDWDLARGRMFWSQSMFELLGLEGRDDLIGFGEVARLIHPDDGDLMALAEELYEAGEATVDRIFRMRHSGGDWVWLRARAELVDRDSGEPHLIGIAVDVTEQMRLIEQSRTADIRLRDAIETISEAFVLWDADNRLVMCNSKFQQLHAIPDSALAPGTTYAEVVEAGRKPLVHSQVVAEGRHDEDARSFEVQMEDGRWLQINERRTKDGGFVSVGTDITQLKRHEGRLIEGERQLMATIADLRQSRQKLEIQAQQMVELAEKYAEEKDRAEDANRTKSEFLANISHELRTPLNAVIGFSEIMQSGMFGNLGSPKYFEYCKDIHQSGTYLLGVINDILDMSRIEAGRMALDLDDLVIDDLVEESIRIVSAQAKAQEIEVVAEVGENLTMRGDRRALKQIMLNLLSNAVKFTPEGGTITVRAHKTATAIIFSVRDTGIGIPREALKKLGRPFEQVSNQFTKSHRGSGLGLAITSSLAELHGGAMRIRSREGVGTIVSVRLPPEPPARAPAADAA
jgi:two-component system, cell cycle sensor histidine kinase PleC